MYPQISDTTASLTLEALGVVIEVLLPPPAESHKTETVAAWRDAASLHGAVCAPSCPVALSPLTWDDPARALSDLSTQVTIAALDALRGSRLLLHAAGVAAPDGRVLALVGPSGRGKTTAARRLCRQYGYVSDESVAVDEALTVWPYRKPLSIIVEGKSVKEQIAPSDLGLLPLPDAPLRLAGITLLERDPDADGIRIVPVDLVDAICEMTPQISYLTELPAPLQYVARIIDQVGPVTRLIYRDAAELPAVVQRMFETHARPGQVWCRAPRAMMTGPWRCADVDDAILVDGRACILYEGVVTALDHRGCLVWSMCLSGATTDEIARAAVAAFGAPVDGDPRDVIARTLDELTAHGLLEPA